MNPDRLHAVLWFASPRGNGWMVDSRKDDHRSNRFTKSQMSWLALTCGVG